MRITSIEVQKKDKTRCSVFVDGNFYCGLKTEVALQHKLAVGMDIEGDFLAELQFESEKSTALEKAMRHMSLSLKTERDMRRFLREKGYLDQVIDYCIDKLKYYGYVDDENYCMEYIRTCHNMGAHKIEFELRKRGIDSDLVKRVMEDYEENDSELDAVIERYMRGKERDFKTRRKVAGYLFSRGYDSDIIKEAVNRYFSDVPEDSDEDESDEDGSF